jgi:hypothetical protein
MFVRRLIVPLVLSLVPLAAVARPAGHIETTDFADAREAIDAQAAAVGADNVLVVLDIDNTTLATDLDLGSEHWFLWQSQLVRDGNPTGEAAAASVPELLTVQGWIYTVTGMHPVEPRIPVDLSQLAAQGVRSLALTSRGLDVRDATLRELARYGFPYASAAPGPVGGYGGAYKPYDPTRPEDSGLTSGDVTRFSLGEAKDVIYENGVMLTQGQHRGVMLRTLLAKTGAQPRAIVFVDDRPHHLEGVQAAFETRDEAIVTVRYVHEKRRVDAFNAGDKGEVNAQWCEFSRGLGVLYDAKTTDAPFLPCRE